MLTIGCTCAQQAQTDQRHARRQGQRKLSGGELTASCVTSHVVRCAAGSAQLHLSLSLSLSFSLSLSPPPPPLSLSPIEALSKQTVPKQTFDSSKSNKSSPRPYPSYPLVFESYGSRPQYVPPLMSSTSARTCLSRVPRANVRELLKHVAAGCCTHTSHLSSANICLDQFVAGSQNGFSYTIHNFAAPPRRWRGLLRGLNCLRARSLVASRFPKAQFMSTRPPRRPLL